MRNSPDHYEPRAISQSVGHGGGQAPGFWGEEALSLAKAFTSLTTQSKAQRLGLSQPRPEYERERI